MPKVVNVNPTGATRIIAITNQEVPLGAEVDVDADLAASLLDQECWAKPGTDEAKDARSRAQAAARAEAKAAKAEGSES